MSKYPNYECGECSVWLGGCDLPNDELIKLCKARGCSLLREEVKPVARWVLGEGGKRVCSKCGEETPFHTCGPAFYRSFCEYRSNYCPGCGAQMRRMCEKCEHFSTCDRENPVCGEGE